MKRLGRWSIFLLLAALCSTGAMVSCGDDDDDDDNHADPCDCVGPPPGVEVEQSCYYEGDKLPAADGCNTCECTDGDWACTAMGCDDDDDDDDDDNDDNDDNDTTDSDWRYIRDEQGRAIVFRGCNFDGNAKRISGLPQRTEQEAEDLVEVWGFNFARYLIFWARIEPEMGIYDDVYLDAVEDWLDILHAKGLTVVLDMHQDVWGPYIKDDGNHSDGAPEWATITDNWPHIPFSTYFGNWAFDYLSPATLRAFDNFWAYDRHPELQDHYADMWAYVAARFKDHPAVLGYDIMNEPFQGTSILRYRTFDETLFSDFNQRMINAIREVDSEGWVFYEPCALATNQGMPQFIRVLNDPRQGPDRLAYFPHLYPALIDLAGGYYPEIDQTIERWEQYRLEDIEKQRAPLLVGEWSMLSSFDEENLHLWTKKALKMFDRVSSGWAYWDCNAFIKGFDDEYRGLIGSVYARKIAGTPVSMNYDPDTRVFELAFENRKGTTGPTEIYIPEDREYPGGWMLSVTDSEGTWTSDWDADAQVLSVWTDPESPSHTITLEPQIL